MIFIHNGSEITTCMGIASNQKHKIHINIFKDKNMFFEFQAADH